MKTTTLKTLSLSLALLAPFLLSQCYTAYSARDLRPVLPDRSPGNAISSHDMIFKSDTGKPGGPGFQARVQMNAAGKGLLTVRHTPSGENRFEGLLGATTLKFTDPDGVDLGTVTDFHWATEPKVPCTEATFTATFQVEPKIPSKAYRADLLMGGKFARCTR